MDLLGYKVFITGGSRGIGAATARQAVLQGAQVAFSYNKGQQKAKDLLKELEALSSNIQDSKESSKAKPFAVQMDLTDQDSIAKACKEVLEGFGGQN